MRAGRPAAMPPARVWSNRALIQSSAGSTISTTACPATTVVPGSARRRTTSPALGAIRRKLAFCFCRAARSAPVRPRSCTAAERLACAAASAASAAARAWRRWSRAVRVSQPPRNSSSPRVASLRAKAKRALASATCEAAACSSAAERPALPDAAAMRWSRSTGSITARTCPASTRSPTSTARLATRPGAVGPIRWI